MQKFCIVRNPWDRVVSLYHHHRKVHTGRTAGGPFRLRMKRVAKSLWKGLPTFEEFVDNLDPSRGLSQSMARFAQDVYGNWLVDDILFYEELDDLPKYLQSIGVPVEQLPYTNYSAQRMTYRDYYDERLKQVVYDTYREDIDYFGYTF